MKDIKKLIYDHVYADVTSLVKFSLEYSEEEHAPIAYADIEGCSFVCPDCGSSKFTLALAKNLPLDTVYDKEYGMMLYKCPICHAEYDTQKEARECCIPDKNADEEVWKCQDCSEVFENFDELIPCMPTDIEWWLVSKNLYDELKAGMEYVAEVGGAYYWGNQETNVPLSENSILLTALEVL